MKFKSLIAAIILVILSIFGSSAFSERSAAYAASSVSSAQAAFEKQNVMVDLESSTVDGKPFDLKDYGFNDKKYTTVFSFVEYCYSFSSSRQTDYALYVYLYNPQGIKFKFNSVQNKIQIGFGETPDEWNKYPLQFLNYSTESNYLGLFAKYKVILSDDKKQAILETLNSTERVYHVSSIEMLIDNGSTNAVDYPATGVIDERSKGEKVYRYTGYAKGFGADINAETLSMNCTEGDVLSLEVHHTSWREKGVTNGKDQYTQDSLNSVYFAVPKTIVNKYGYLSEVHAEWRNAVTNWGLLTGNYDVYRAYYEYVGQDIGSGNRSDIGYQVLVNRHGGNGASSSGKYWADIGYNPWYAECLVLLTQLNWLFYANGGLNSADSAVISSEKITKWYQGEFRKIVGENYGDVLDCKDGLKVYKALFESVDDEIKDYHIEADEQQTLVGQKWTADSWWIFSGILHPDGEPVPTYADKIHKVTDDDFGSSEEMTCDNLYISTSDYADFKKFYDDNKEENNIYLMRFAVTDYVSCEAEQWDYNTTLGVVNDKKLDTNAYLFKQSVFLDFDIIDVTFDNGKVKTVIPCVSNPIDIFPEVTPPPIPTTDDPEFNFWQWLLDELRKGTWWVWLIVIVVGLVVLGLLIKVLSLFVPIFGTIWSGLKTGLGWLFKSPYKLLKKLSVKLKARAEERRKRKEYVRQQKLIRKEQAKIESYQNDLNRKENNRQKKLDDKERQKAITKAQRAKLKSDKQTAKLNKKAAKKRRQAAKKRAKSKNKAKGKNKARTTKKSVKSKGKTK